MIASLLLHLYRQVGPALMNGFRPVSTPYRKVDENLVSLPDSTTPLRRIWFHAASSGELESLVPLVELALTEGSSAVVTVFSPSALGRLAHLSTRWKSAFPSANLLWGASPAEGEWRGAIKRSRIALFLTVKYEAWPDLWASLGEAGVPLFLVGAQSRPSLSWMGWLFRAVGIPLPRIQAFLSDSEDEDAVRKDLPEAVIRFAGDPRWDRVQARLASGSSRVSFLREATAELRAGRREGVIGSAWGRDLQCALAPLADRREQFLWIVPHDPSLSGLEEVLTELRGLFGGERFLLSSQIRGVERESREGLRIVVVDEMGFLAELYAHADWAFVGGGFGAGVHSTLEPAAAGIPVACGPARVGFFSETRSLRRSEQLTVVRDAREFASWMDRVDHLMASRSELWKTDVEKQFGATDRIWREIQATPSSASRTDSTSHTGA